MSLNKGILIAFSIVAVVFLGAAPADANHAWGDYHWGRTANPFPLELGDNVSDVWDAHLATASSDWSFSNVLNTVVMPGTSNRNCKATTGRVEVCAAGYGFNGWLGIAQIWISGSHITKGVVKMNDTYFSQSAYDTPEWRQFVMCQEIGHTFGLNHQDEDFNNPNLNTCMDYTSDPASNQHPNQHDYDMLATIYEHLDSVNTYIVSGDEGGGGKGNGKGKPGAIPRDIDLSNPSAWGQAIKTDARGNHSLYVRDLGNGEKVFTFVTWVENGSE